MEWLITHQEAMITLVLLSGGPGRGLMSDMTDLMIPTEPVTANILDVRKAVWGKLILVFIHRHDRRVG